jgi:hypothetical protein
MRLQEIALVIRTRMTRGLPEQLTEGVFSFWPGDGTQRGKPVPTSATEVQQWAQARWRKDTFWLAPSRGHSSHMTTTKWDVRHAGLARYRIQAGRGGRLVGLGVHAGEWSALSLQRSRNVPLQREVVEHTRWLLAGGGGGALALA